MQLQKLQDSEVTVISDLMVVVTHFTLPTNRILTITAILKE